VEQIHTLHILVRMCLVVLQGEGAVELTCIWCANKTAALLAQHQPKVDLAFPGKDDCSMPTGPLSAVFVSRPRLCVCAANLPSLLRPAHRMAQEVSHQTPTPPTLPSAAQGATCYVLHTRVRDVVHQARETLQFMEILASSLCGPGVSTAAAVSWLAVQSV